jgi:very-short-patch-repair endonuclease
MQPARRAVIAAVESLAEQQYGVVSRRQAATMGAHRDRVAREVAAGRWCVRGLHTVAIHRGPLPRQALWWSALFEVGSAAALDGTTALQAAGLEGYDDIPHVSVLHGSQPRRTSGVRVHEVRAWDEEDVMPVGIRRVRPAVAAVRAAAWARTHRQASLILLMTVQQGLATAPAMLEEVGRRTRLRRRPVIVGVLLEAASGVQALGELDFARLCRQRGLPEPDRQVVRRGRGGRVYLDVFWDRYGVVVEIEGLHHAQLDHLVDDSLRQNDLSITTGTVLRIPSLGLRLHEDDFMTQVEQLLCRRGWRGRRAA